MQSAENCREDPLLNKTHFSGISTVEGLNSPGSESAFPLNREVVTSREDFKNLALEWAALGVRYRSVCVFIRWEWHYTWWQMYAGQRAALRERGFEAAALDSVDGFDQAFNEPGELNHESQAPVRRKSVFASPRFCQFHQTFCKRLHDTGMRYYDVKRGEPSSCKEASDCETSALVDVSVYRWHWQRVVAVACRYLRTTVAKRVRGVLRC